MDMFWRAPPIARTLAGTAFTMSILVYLGFLSGYWVVFSPSCLWKLPPQLWRFVSSFLLTGPELSILFDPYFLYTYGSKLEISSPRFTQPGDFPTYLAFVGSVIMGLNLAFTGASVYTSALILALAYTSSQDDRGGSTNFFFVNIPTVLVPFAMLFITLITGGFRPMFIQLTGLVAAHLHDFLSKLWPSFGGGKNLLPTPKFVTRIFQTTEATISNKTYGTSFTPAQKTPKPATGPLPESWGSRGSGHRLGGN